MAATGGLLFRCRLCGSLGSQQDASISADVVSAAVDDAAEATRVSARTDDPEIGSRDREEQPTTLFEHSIRATQAGMAGRSVR
mmetsp:Transcript_51612/g.95544  ORF Transcript_51612/g.95544 Transcript_51612/m.95544 type:complete len:83 (-) Transcript_51612:765-1013(-)